MKLVPIVFLLALSMFVHGGDMEIQPPRAFPTLETLVGKADLVLRCRAEDVRGKRRWRVVEAIKGEYRPKMFDQEIPGFISRTGTVTLANPLRQSNRTTKHAEEIVFIRRQHLHSAEDNQWHDLYYADESFPVVADRIVYPKTVLWNHTTGSVERVFSLAEFNTAIKAVR